MSLLYHNDKLVFFAHVPKAGGTSVEALLRTEYGDVHMHDWQWKARGSYDSGFATSPQHLAAEAVAQIFPSGLFDYSFAVVRHPFERICSSFRYQMNGGFRHRFRSLGFSAWVETMLSATERVRSFSDNHFRPQVELIPENSEIFRLEDQRDELVERLRSVLGPGKKGEGLPHANKSKKEQKTLLVRARDVERINAFYVRDYEAFGYDMPDPADFSTSGQPVMGRLIAPICSQLLAAGWRHRLINP